MNSIFKRVLLTYGYETEKIAWRALVLGVLESAFFLVSWGIFGMGDDKIANPE